MKSARIIEQYDSNGGLWGRRIEAPDGPQWQFLRNLPTFEAPKSIQPIFEIAYTVK